MQCSAIWWAQTIGHAKTRYYRSPSCLITAKEGGKKQKRATKTQSWQRVKCVFILNYKTYFLKHHKACLLGVTGNVPTWKAVFYFKVATFISASDYRVWLQAARVSCSKWESGWTQRNAVGAERTGAEKHGVTENSNGSSAAEWVSFIKWSGNSSWLKEGANNN